MLLWLAPSTYLSSTLPIGCYQTCILLLDVPPHFYMISIAAVLNLSGFYRDCLKISMCQEVADEVVAHYLDSYSKITPLMTVGFHVKPLNALFVAIRAEFAGTLGDIH